MPDYVPYNTVDECEICEKLVPCREFERNDKACLDCVGSTEWLALREKREQEADHDRRC